MTSSTAIDIKEVQIFDQRDYDELPWQVKAKVEGLITAAQNRINVPPSNRKELKGRLSGISEFRIKHMTNEFRIYYMESFEEVLYILDAGMKKSKTGGEIPQEQVARLIDRADAARREYDHDRVELKSRYLARLQRSASNEKVSRPIPRPRSKTTYEERMHASLNAVREQQLPQALRLRKPGF